MYLSFSANMYLFKVNNRNSKRCEICSKFTAKTPERINDVSGVFIVNFENMSHLFSIVSNANFEQVNISWVNIEMIH